MCVTSEAAIAFVLLYRGGERPQKYTEHGRQVGCLRSVTSLAGNVTSLELKTESGGNVVGVRQTCVRSNDWHNIGTRLTRRPNNAEAALPIRSQQEDGLDKNTLLCKFRDIGPTFSK